MQPEQKNSSMIAAIADDFLVFRAAIEDFSMKSIGEKI